MKKSGYMLILPMLLTLVLGVVGCSSDSNEDNSVLGESQSTFDKKPYEAILGEWMLVKTVPENALGGVDYLVFYSDSTFAYRNVESKNELLKGGKYEIVNQDCNVGTVDMQQLPSKYHIRLTYPEKSLDGHILVSDYPFIIEGNKMHLHLDYAYIYTSYMFEHVK